MNESTTEQASEIRIEGKEILARGANVFPGYFENEQATRTAFTDDGWFRTGDIGEIDDQGFVKITDRMKDIIISGGLNISAAEVERAVSDYPGVEEVVVIAAPAYVAAGMVSPLDEGLSELLAGIPYSPITVAATVPSVWPS